MFSGTSGQITDLLRRSASVLLRAGVSAFALLGLLIGPATAEYDNELEIHEGQFAASHQENALLPPLPRTARAPAAPIPTWTLGSEPSRPPFPSPMPGYGGHAIGGAWRATPTGWSDESLTTPQSTTAPGTGWPSDESQWPAQSAFPAPVYNQPTYPGSLVTPGAPIGDDWIILPDGLLYRSYLAGIKESRFASVWLWEKDRGLVWESVLGGRMGVVRYGTPDHVFGEGFQLDMEGGAFARVDPTMESAPLEGTDFRFGLIGTWRFGPLATKVGYYHLSSHVGDEYMQNNPGFVRVNYVRDSLLWGVSYDMTEDVRLYSEIGYAIGHEGGALPLEFQFGMEYSPMDCHAFRGSPFAAINGHFREDFDWIGSVNLVAGWQWRGPESKHALRLGFQFYSGPAMQFEFLDRYEQLAGVGIWYDF